MSWASDLKEYERQKRTLSFSPEPVVRVTQREVKLRESAFDPIAQRFTDPRAEQEALSHEETQKIKKANAAMACNFVVSAIIVD